MELKIEIKKIFVIFTGVFCDLNTTLDNINV